MTRKQIAAVLAALGVFGASLAGLLGTPAPPSATVTYETANGKKVEAPKSAVAAAASNGERNLVTPRSFLGAEHKAGRSSDRANPDAPRVDGPVPAASPFQRGCLTRSNTTNFSYRNGTRPSLIVPHLTVAPNRPGWGDINGVAAFLNRPATSASANYIVDNEDRCIYTVAEVFKAWTQAGYNSATACSIEQQNTGNEVRYGSPDLHQLAIIVHDCAARWHIPLQRAQVSGGRVLRSGVIDHFHLGAVGGGHVDIHRFGAGCLNAGPNADTWRCVDFIIAQARKVDGGSSAAALTVGQRKRCQELNRIRKYVKGQGWTPALLRRAQAIKRGEKQHGLVCAYGPPGRLRPA